MRERRAQRWVGALALAALAGVLLLALGQLASPAPMTQPAGAASGAPAQPAPGGAASSVGAAADGGFLRDYQSLQTEFQPLPWWTLAGDVAFKLLIVLGLFFLAVRLLKPLASGASAGAPQGLVNVLGTMALGPQRQLYLLEVGDKVILVGATSQQLSALGEITDPDVVERMRAAQRAASVPFAEQLSGLMEQWAPRLLREQLHEGQGTVRARLAEWRRLARGGGAEG